MRQKPIRVICIVVMLNLLVITTAYAFVYQTQTHNITQTIMRNWLSDWSKRVRITIDHNDVSSDLSNFPVLVHLSSSSGVGGENLAFIFNEIGSNNKKIAITTSNATQCYVEVEKWTYPLNSTTDTPCPNTIGDATQIASVYPAGTPHWQTVNETTPNNDTNYVYTSSTSSNYQMDLYNIPDHTVSGTINNVTVYFCFRTSSTFYTAYARAAVKTHGSVYNGTAESSASTSYSTRSYTWTNNPYTGLPWTWTEIDSLQAGLGLRISSSSGNARCTQVYVEINYTPSGGEAWLWTNVPSIYSTADTRLYFYYDKNHADNTNYVGDTGSTPARNVWSYNYGGVWHLKENPAGTAPQMKDSTSNANHGISAGAMLSADQVSAEIDGGLSFDGSNNEITCGNGASLQITASLTIEAWAKPSSTSVIQGIVNKEIGSPSYYGYQLRLYSDNRYRFAVGDPSLYYAASDSVYTDNQWHYVVGVKSTTNYLYVDGVQQASTFTRSITDSGANFDIGRAYSNYNGYWWNGQIDEVRVSNVARSAAWIDASYESGRDHLVSFGIEETF